VSCLRPQLYGCRGALYNMRSRRATPSIILLITCLTAFWLPSLALSLQPNLQHCGSGTRAMSWLGYGARSVACNGEQYRLESSVTPSTEPARYCVLAARWTHPHLSLNTSIVSTTPDSTSDPHVMMCACIPNQPASDKRRSTQCNTLSNPIVGDSCIVGTD
jgi:hypothetical protein